MHERKPLFDMPGKDRLPTRIVRPLFLLLLALYLLLGSLYTLRTPLWQVPDEPAHVNYVLHLARTGTLPILQMGDYDAAYLERIKAAKFPPDMPVAPIRYESHQPPAYYVLAAALVHVLVPSALVPNPDRAALAQAVHTLRLFSLVLSLGTLLAAFAIARRLFPRHPSIALAVVAFIAFIPQHMAMMAGVNNDALAEPLLAVFLWMLIRDLRGGRLRYPALGHGVLFGVLLLTKTTVYLPALLALLTYHALMGLTRTRRWSSVLSDGLVDVGLAALIALPFYARNVVVYGWPDVLGLRRHAQIVVGQMTTGEFIARHGWAAYWDRAITWTFRSFWGQFGWMGVLMDARVYRALAYFSAILLLAALALIACGRRDRHERALLGRPTRYVCLTPYQHNGLGVLAMAALGTVISYVGYNFSFLQHQGRYLFTALVPLAMFVVPGLWLLLHPHRAHWGAAVLVVSAVVALALALVDVGGMTRWDALSLLALALWMALAWRVPRWRPLWLLAPFLLLALLDLWVLYRFILPALT